MTNREIMLAALEKHTLPYLAAKGFGGKYPHFKRENEDFTEFISFVTNKYGGSFYAEASVIFPKRKNKNYLPCGGAEITLFDTNKRYRLPGMFDGWFYYSDVYKTRIKAGLFRRITMYSENGYTCVQRFGEDTAEQICREINTQLEKTFLWMAKFEKKNR